MNYFQLKPSMINYFYDPESDSKLIKDSYTNKTIYRDKKNHKPIFKVFEYTQLGKYPSKECILEDLINNHFIASKIFSQYYKKTKIFNNLEEAVIFNKNVKDNHYKIIFYLQTIDLIKKKKHPFLLTHFPEKCWNGINGEIYNGVSQLMLQYSNIYHNNKCKIFFSNYLIHYYNANLKNNAYSIILEYKNKYQMVTPLTHISKIKTLVTPKDNTLILPVVENKLEFIVYNYFDSLYNNKIYNPEKNIELILLPFLKNHPFEFINIIENIHNIFA